ncbi:MULTISPECIES: hypothetical protein [Gordonia]|uniref:Uncharacterized protein n=1 Tax=Gordonia sputi NBRC 100414 TaxID=1089453 RepID=H5U6B1_9ACTN|nr:MULTISPECIES: hypothetical protein [Gordonia]NKY92202.1 hypothetical protein [Gordonia sputi]OBA73815.1 hypothetical protein A5777_00825 [Gordonia sp. 852002-10350_SCH5691597]GAB41269.1 hypothetical protein GOSPT_125_00360 [Gordonia sputi NBRC 100414]
MPDNPTPHSSPGHQLDWMDWSPGNASEATAPQAPEAATRVHLDSSAAAPPTISLKKGSTSAAAPTLPPGTPAPTNSGREATQASQVASDARLYIPPAAPAAPYQSPYQPAGRPPSKSSWWLIGVGLVVVFALIVGGAVWAATKGPLKANNSSTRSASGAQNLPDTLTRCAQPLTTSSPQASLTSSGLAVTFTASSPCSGGDVLSGSQAAVAVLSSAGPVANGTFDFSSSPIGVPPQPDSRQITLTYPTGSFYQLPDASSGSNLTIQITDSGATGTSALSSSQATGPASATASQAGQPTGVNVDSVAAQSLRAQVDADRARILSSSNNQWVAQLSSKQPGLVADGKTWTNKDILDEFAANYQRFSGARLLWSDDWSVFSSSGWWVTITAQTFPSPQAAVAWCQQQNFDRDHCLGKLISNTAPPEGSTAYIR